MMGKKPIPLTRLSSEVIQKIDVWADVFNSSRSEIMRNWMEDILRFLEKDFLEMNEKRHLEPSEKLKKILKESAEALYYVSENGDSKVFNLEKYEELSNKILEILEEK